MSDLPANPPLAELLAAAGEWQTSGEAAAALTAYERALPLLTTTGQAPDRNISALRVESKQLESRVVATGGRNLVFENAGARLRARGRWRKGCSFVWSRP